MANPFGEEVDDEKLDQMLRYVGKPKTQEDRAREAMHLINEDGKSDKAIKYAQSVKDDYGSGIATYCVIYNATGDTLHYVAYRDWFGYVGRTPYPTEIGNGQWASFLHVHPTGSPCGSEGAIVYRGKNKDGYQRDYLLAWNSPSIFQSNSAYSEAGAVDSFQSRWNQIYNKLENSGHSDTTNSEGCRIEVDIGGGGAPLFRAIVKIPFSE